jgi:hypothetical protein
MSPVVLRVGPYRFLFFASDAPEPPHVHVASPDASAKFWLTGEVVLARNFGYDRRELGRVARLVGEHRVYLEEKWHEFFGAR